MTLSDLGKPTKIVTSLKLYANVSVDLLKHRQI